MSNDNKIVIILTNNSKNIDFIKSFFSNAFSTIFAETIDETFNSIQKNLYKTYMIVVFDDIGTKNSLELVKKIYKCGWTDKIPVVYFAEKVDIEVEKSCLSYGVDDYFTKDIDKSLLKLRIDNNISTYEKRRELVNLVVEEMVDRDRNNNLMVSILSQIVEFRNGESGLHVNHIRIITEKLLEYLITKTDKYHITLDDIENIRMASTLHDIGKLVIPDEILNKPGKLTSEEYEVMKTHSIVGANMIKTVKVNKGDENLIKTAYDICRWHHERWDGNGYPDGLKGDDIPISAQVVSIADVYDALISERCYKVAYRTDEALDMIRNGDCGKFNPILIKCLTEAQNEIDNELFESYDNFIERKLSNITGKIIEKSKEHHNKSVEFIDYEKEKLSILASLSNDITFEYNYAGNYMSINEYGMKAFNFPEIVIDPLKNADFLKLIGKDRVQFVTNLVKSLKDTNCKLSVNIPLNVKGKSVMHKVNLFLIFNKEDQKTKISLLGRICPIN